MPSMPRTAPLGMNEWWYTEGKAAASKRIPGAVDDVAAGSTLDRSIHVERYDAVIYLSTKIDPESGII